jgi:hypothetical protein
MTGPDPLRVKATVEAETAAALSLERTVRIEHDRRRLAFAVFASGVATLALPVMLVVGMMHPTRPAPAWTLAPLGLAVVIAAFGLLRNIGRLQDGDPALVISQRGLSFRPQVFGETARIPWTAIRGFRSRSYKQQRFIVVQVDDADRYVSRAGFLHLLRRLGKRRAAANEISFSTPMAKQAWKDLELVLQRYLAHYGTRTAPADGGSRHRGSADNPAASDENSRSVS